MKRHTVRQRLAAFLLAALMSLSWLPPLPAFAEDGIAETVSAAETDFSVSEDEATPETAKTESNSGEDVTSESGTTQNEQAQAFMDAVTALDRESILSAVNTWALASQAWQAEKDNPDLTAALEIATAASDEAAAPVYAAEDLYNSLTDEERAQETVQNAYSALAALIVTMQLTMENPTAPEESGGTPPDQDEIATVPSCGSSRIILTVLRPKPICLRLHSFWGQIMELVRLPLARAITPTFIALLPDMHGRLLL